MSCITYCCACEMRKKRKLKSKRSDTSLNILIALSPLSLTFFMHGFDPSIAVFGQGLSQSKRNSNSKKLK